MSPYLRLFSWWCLQVLQLNYRPLSRRLDRCDRVIQNESRYPFGGNVYYVTMQVTFITRKFRNEERNLHCDVVHITTKWVCSLTLGCNGVFAIKAYCVLTRRKSGPIETTLSGDAASCARQQKTMSTEWYTPFAWFRHSRFKTRLGSLSAF